MLQVYEYPFPGVKLSNGTNADLKQCVVRLHAPKHRKVASSKSTGSVLGAAPMYTATVLCNFQPVFAASAKKLQPGKLGCEPLMGYLMVVTSCNSAGEETEKSAVVSTEQVRSMCFEQM